jgi:AcrR family transcriptional regulator
MSPLSSSAGPPAGPPSDQPGEGSPRRRGRRPAGEDTRAAILVAARSEFAARGYEGATLRGIARAAGVDPRLVHHYFDGKDDVFAASMQLPVRPAEVVSHVIEGGVEGIGERLVRLFFHVWETEEGRERLVAMLTSVVSSEAAARMIKEFLTKEFFGRLAAGIGGRDQELRAALAASQMIGLMMARYVVKIEPLASADVEDLVPLMGPVLQRYLSGDFDEKHRSWSCPAAPDGVLSPHEE